MSFGLVHVCCRPTCIVYVTGGSANVTLHVAVAGRKINTESRPRPGLDLELLLVSIAIHERYVRGRNVD